MYECNIVVNGERVRLTDFPNKIISKTLVGMLQSLKGVEEINSAVIELEKIERSEEK